MEMVRLEMVKLLLLCASITGVASAADFSLTIGAPVAAGPGVKVVKSKAAMLFAVRLEECSDPASAQISATAEGLVNGARTSLPVMPVGAGSPGVYLVAQTWPAEGVWAVSLSATCGPARAGAIVPVSNQGFVREEVKLLPRPATPAEIQQALLHAVTELMKKP
jgi:hypothetical protein